MIRRTTFVLLAAALAAAPTAAQPGAVPAGSGAAPIPGLAHRKPTAAEFHPDVLQRVKDACVLIRVDNREGARFGSGWFGVAPNLVFTTARVLGMTTPGSRPPEKITLWPYAGEKQEVEIPHAKIKILAVDREMDLACLEIVGVKDLPAPLPLRAAASLDLLEKLVAFGHPAATRLGQPSRDGGRPSVIVGKTEVMGLRKDVHGNLHLVQMQGGIAPGGSGGPVVDMDGNAVAVSVRGDANQESRFANIAFGVPTEFAHGLVAGRIAGVEYGQAYYKGDRVALPVTVRCFDPRKKLTEVGIAAWVGADDKGHRPPGTDLTPKPSDTEPAATKLTYDPDKQTATGEVLFPKPEDGRTYWVQPYSANAAVPRHYLAGTTAPVAGSPVERVPAELVARYRLGGKRTVTVSTSQEQTELEEGEWADPDEREVAQMVFKLNETVVKWPAPEFAAAFNYGFTGWELSRIAGRTATLFPPDRRRVIEQALKCAVLTAKATKLGEFALVNFGLANPQMELPPQVVPLVQLLGNQAFDAIRRGSIPLPGKAVNPGETWTATGAIAFKVATARPRKGPDGQPLPATFRDYRAKEELTYTYLGVRDHGGQKQVVVRVEGKVVPAAGAAADSASGIIKGVVRLEEGTGVVVESEIRRMYEVDTSEKGVKKRVVGVEEHKVVRGPAGD